MDLAESMFLNTTSFFLLQKTLQRNISGFIFLLLFLESITSVNASPDMVYAALSEVSIALDETLGICGIRPGRLNDPS